MDAAQTALCAIVEGNCTEIATCIPAMALGTYTDRELQSLIFPIAKAANALLRLKANIDATRETQRADRARWAEQAEGKA